MKKTLNITEKRVMKKPVYALYNEELEYIAACPAFSDKREAELCDADTKVSVSIDHEAEMHIYRREDDNTKTQTFAVLSIKELETDNLK